MGKSLTTSCLDFEDLPFSNSFALIMIFRLIAISILASAFVNSMQAQKPGNPIGMKEFFDFSLSGYHLGKEMPTRSVVGKRTFNVIDFGAKLKLTKKDGEFSDGIRGW